MAFGSAYVLFWQAKYPCQNSSTTSPLTGSKPKHQTILFILPRKEAMRFPPPADAGGFQRIIPMKAFEPAYLNLLESGALKERSIQAYANMAKCNVCAWECGVDRLSGKLGVCRTGVTAKVSSYGAHMGEENVLRGWRGSGTIFFTRCNLHCQYCQNHDISQTDSGDEYAPEQLATLMLELQGAGCHNINLVSPSHIVPQILAAVLIAAEAGLRLPLAYNTGGYDSLTSLHLLDGVVDIYMPDMKYASLRLVCATRKSGIIPKSIKLPYGRCTGK
jgi:uncharacterized Fe-S radical SAM superfamily protein PflX